MKKVIKEKLLDQEFLAKLFELRSKATVPVQMAKELGISVIDVRDALISPEYKAFSEDWFNTIQDSSRMARAKINNLEESVNAIIPAMSMVGEKARIFIVSTPKGRNGYYSDRLQQICPNAFGICDDIRLQKIEPFQVVRNEAMRMSTCFVSWREHPTYGSNPNFLQEKAEQQGLTQSAVSQEYDLNFAIEESNVFSTDEILKLTNTEIIPEIDGDGSSLYYAGLDTAYGSSGDYLVCSIFKAVYTDDGVEQYSGVQVY